MKTNYTLTKNKNDGMWYLIGYTKKYPYGYVFKVSKTKRALVALVKEHELNCYV